MTGRDWAESRKCASARVSQCAGVFVSACVHMEANGKQEKFTFVCVQGGKLAEHNGRRHRTKLSTGENMVFMNY